MPHLEILLPLPHLHNLYRPHVHPNDQGLKRASTPHHNRILPDVRNPPLSSCGKPCLCESKEVFHSLAAASTFRETSLLKKAYSDHHPNMKF